MSLLRALREKLRGASGKGERRRREVDDAPLEKRSVRRVADDPPLKDKGKGDDGEDDRGD